MSECDRCGKTIKKGYPLDGVVHTDTWVCKDCVKPWDEVVDV